MIYTVASILITAATVGSVSGQLDGGFQSGPAAGSIYAGGMAYHKPTNTLYMTGIHYNKGLEDGRKSSYMGGTDLDEAANCFVSKLDLNDSGSTVETNDDGTHTFRKMSDWLSFGKEGVTESCSALTLGKEMIVVGSVEKDGYLYGIGEDDGTQLSDLVGMVGTFSMDNLVLRTGINVQSQTEPSGKHLMYNIAAVNEGSFVYVAALTSTDDQIDPSVEKLMAAGADSEIDWHEHNKLGSSFYVTVYKLRRTSDMQRFKLVWMKEFPINKDSDGVTTPRAYLGGMILQEDMNGVKHLIVAGSTRGTGQGYGPADPDTIDEDGFLMQLATDGEFLKEKRHKGKSTEYQGVDNLREGTGSDDFVRGICQRSKPKDDQDMFYIVGGTKGDMTADGQGPQNGSNSGFQFGLNVENKYKDTWQRGESIMPFLRQVSFARDLAPVWTTQWAAMPSEELINETGRASLPTTAYAMDCAVDERISAVYVVGIVSNGASMAQGDIEMINQGGDDIWVAKVDEATGNVYWLTQVGGFGNDKVAKRGSVAVTDEGNVIIYGNTDGNLYRQRTQDGVDTKSDIFLVTVDGQTGAVTDNYYLGGTSSATVAGTVAGAPDDVIVPGGGPIMEIENQDNESIQNNPQDATPKVNTVAATSMSKEKGSSKVLIIVGVLIGILLVLAALYFFCKYRVKKRSSESQKSSIFACLQQFDVEDIDLRRSPPGGWHGTYLNKLAYGVNEAGQVDTGTLPTGSYSDSLPLTGEGGVPPDGLFKDKSSEPDVGGYRDDPDYLDEEDEVDIRLKDKDLL